MNGHCETCSIEKMCGYEYKPTQCRDHLKFKAIPPALQNHMAEAVSQHQLAQKAALLVFRRQDEQT